MQNMLNEKRTFKKGYLIFVLFITLGCSRDKSNPPSNGIISTNLFTLEEAIKHSNVDFVNLVNQVRGSVGANGSGSKVIWSRKNEYKLGLFVSANHVYGLSFWPSFKEEFIDILSINNGIYLGSKLPPANGDPILNNELNANFGLYHPAIPVNATNTSILPEHDFYLGIVDNQRTVDNGFAVYPTLVQTSRSLQLFDPLNRTLANQSWSEPNRDKLVIAIGYPRDKIAFPNGAVATGKVYSNEEAETIIRSLKQNNNEEGNIPYKLEVEFLANVPAVTGMSGGGVFNTEGQLLGIMVRATDLNGEPILRVVKMSYIVQKMKDCFNSLSASNKERVRPFISGELN